MSLDTISHTFPILLDSYQPVCLPNNPYPFFKIPIDKPSMSTGLFTLKAQPCVCLSLRLQAACASAIYRLENLRGTTPPLCGQLWFSNISRECIRLDAELKDLEQALWLRFPNFTTAPNANCQYDIQDATTALLGSCALTLMVLVRIT